MKSIRKDDQTIRRVSFSNLLVLPIDLICEKISSFLQISFQEFEMFWNSLLWLKNRCISSKSFQWETKYSQEKFLYIWITETVSILNLSFNQYPSHQISITRFFSCHSSKPVSNLFEDLFSKNSSFAVKSSVLEQILRLKSSK